MRTRILAGAVFGLAVLVSATIGVASPRSALHSPGAGVAPPHTPAGPRPATPVTGAHPAARPAPAAPGLDLGLQDGASMLVDARTGAVLYEHNGVQRRAPASLTKIVTVMVALDHAPLTRQVTVPQAATGWRPEDAVMGLSAGEVVSVRELLYGVFLASGNDAAETLAQALMPRDQFIAAMNAQVARLGLTNTHFVNPTGMDAANHYSTASDLAAITRAFWARHGDIMAIAGLPTVTLYATSGHPEYRLVNFNKLVLWPYEGATGLKTGYTPRAGGCVAATATRGGRDLAAIVLGDDVMFSDAGRLFDYGWARG